MRAAAELRIIDGIAGFGVPQPTEWQGIGNQISATSILARADFVNVCMKPAATDVALSGGAHASCGGPAAGAVVAHRRCVPACRL